MNSIHTFRKLLLSFFLLLPFSPTILVAQTDTMFIMKSGAVVAKYNVNNQVDSVIFYKPTIKEPTSGTFTDARDGNVYNWVKIGNQVWMAENLNYTPVGGNSWCYNNITTNCNTLGRLYDWATIMNGDLSSTANPSGVKGVCPTGWHLPSDAEWTQLENYVGVEAAGYKLKATSGWWPSDGTDEFGFKALPGGVYYMDGIFEGLLDGFWWSATEASSSTAMIRSLFYTDYVLGIGSSNKGYGYSVRCVRD
jgi:uncharacterized protein (TIGR02145 family)